jgi:hypothetical protein
VEKEKMLQKLLQVGEMKRKVKAREKIRIRVGKGPESLRKNNKISLFLSPHFPV